MDLISGVTKLAKMLDVDPSTIYRWCDKGMPFVPGRNNKRIFEFNKVKAWLEGESND